MRWFCTWKIDFKKTNFDRNKQDNGPKSPEKYWNIKIGAFQFEFVNLPFVKCDVENTKILSL